MADSTIAKAYVQIIPTTKGITNTLNKELGGSADEAGVSAGKSFGKKMLGALSALGIGAAIGKVLKDAIGEGAALEQSFGGLETIYGEAAEAAKAYAAEAAKAGISANDYAEQAVSFGASLKQAFSGDVTKAAEAANTAILDMTDNAAKMGTPIENIQTAYQGFAKQNYTMLDNLKLGYGGTKTEMERLLADAQKLTGVEYNIDNLGDVYDAIHAVQGSLGLTGVAAAEAKETLSGSLNSMKASFKNVLGKLALGESVAPSLMELSNVVKTFLSGNLFPMVGNIMDSLPDALLDILPDVVNSGTKIMMDFVGSLINQLPKIIDSGITIVLKLVEGIGNALPKLIAKVPQIITGIVTTLSNNIPKIVETGLTLVINLAAGLIKAIPQMVKQLPQIISAIVKGLVSGIGEMANVGLRLVQGLWNGISNAAGWVLDKIKGFGQSILNGIKSIFGIHSPSRETAWMGDMLMQGLANGIDDNAKKAVNSMRNAADSALGVVDTDAFGFNGGNYTFNGSSGNAGTNNVTLNVYGAQGQDVRELANIVMAEIQAATDRRLAAYA